MTSPAQRIATHLQTAAFGTIGADSGTTIAVSGEPATPDEAITVYDTGGTSPDTYDEDVYFKNIQIRLRTNNYNTGYTTMESIRNNLLASPVITAINYIRMEGDILSIGRDDNDRFLLTSNYVLFM